MNTTPNAFFSDTDIFQKCDEILKVECYHHFHAFCMRQYLDYNENNVNVNGVSTCPVCRKEIKVNYSSLLYAPEPYNEKVGLFSFDLYLYAKIINELLLSEFQPWTKIKTVLQICLEFHR